MTQCHGDAFIASEFVHRVIYIFFIHLIRIILAQHNAIKRCSQLVLQTVSKKKACPASGWEQPLLSVSNGLLAFYGFYSADYSTAIFSVIVEIHTKKHYCFNLVIEYSPLRNSCNNEL